MCAALVPAYLPSGKGGALSRKAMASLTARSNSCASIRPASAPSSRRESCCHTIISSRSSWELGAGSVSGCWPELAAILVLRSEPFRHRVGVHTSAAERPLKHISGHPHGVMMFNSDSQCLLMALESCV